MANPYLTNVTASNLSGWRSNLAEQSIVAGSHRLAFIGNETCTTAGASSYGVSFVKTVIDLLSARGLAGREGLVLPGEAGRWTAGTDWVSTTGGMFGGYCYVGAEDTTDELVFTAADIKTDTIQVFYLDNAATFDATLDGETPETGLGGGNSGDIAVATISATGLDNIITISNPTGGDVTIYGIKAIPQEDTFLPLRVDNLSVNKPLTTMVSGASPTIEDYYTIDALADTTFVIYPDIAPLLDAGTTAAAFGEALGDLVDYLLTANPDPSIVLVDPQGGQVGRNPALNPDSYRAQVRSIASTYDLPVFEAHNLLTGSGLIGGAVTDPALSTAGHYKLAVEFVDAMLTA